MYLRNWKSCSSLPIVSAFTLVGWITYAAIINLNKTSKAQVRPMLKAIDAKTHPSMGGVYKYSAIVIFGLIKVAIHEI